METNLIIMHYPNQNQVNPKHWSKVTAISFRWPISGFLWDLRLSPKGLIFMEGQNILVQIMHLTIMNMHAKLLSNWAITFHFIIRTVVKNAKLRKLHLRIVLWFSCICWCITFTIQLNNANNANKTCLLIYWLGDVLAPRRMKMWKINRE